MTQNTLLDADSHVSEPLNLWQERLPAKYRTIAPHMETEYQGRPGAWWFIEQDRQPHNVILGFGANKSLEELQQLLKSFSYAGAPRGEIGRASCRESEYGRGTGVWNEKRHSRHD